METDVDPKTGVGVGVVVVTLSPDLGLTEGGADEVEDGAGVVMGVSGEGSTGLTISKAKAFD